MRNTATSVITAARKTTAPIERLSDILSENIPNRQSLRSRVFLRATRDFAEMIHYCLLILLFSCSVFTFECSEQTTCSNCTNINGDFKSGWNCVWCDDIEKCVEGGPFGSKGNQTNGCGLMHWNYKQCKRMCILPQIFYLIICSYLLVIGFWTLVVTFSAIVLVFVLIILLICCCCCKKKRGRTQAELEERESFLSVQNHLRH
jgi:hypothetical protein